MPREWHVTGTVDDEEEEEEAATGDSEQRGTAVAECDAPRAAFEDDDVDVEGAPPETSDESIGCIEYERRGRFLAGSKYASPQELWPELLPGHEPPDML